MASYSVPQKDENSRLAGASEWAELLGAQTIC
jgi:hypothetical protein